LEETQWRLTTQVRRVRETRTGTLELRFLQRNLKLAIKDEEQGLERGR
jgi:hypothetical protein